MTKIKLCGLTRPCDIAAANELMPEYIGFVFAPKSRRYVSPEKAAGLKRQLLPNISAVGVFVKESPETIAALLNQGIIDMAQLHGGEDEAYIKRLRALIDEHRPGQIHPDLDTNRHGQIHPDFDMNRPGQARPNLGANRPGSTLIQAFRVRDGQDLIAAKHSLADYVLLDSGEGGTGTAFDWELIRQMKHFDRPYFLAGGLTPGNVGNAVASFTPYAVDVSSGIETDGKKDAQKMKAFVHAVRSANESKTSRI